MDTRPSIAGRWYPHRPEHLRRDLAHYFAQAEVQPPAGRVWGVVAPHAGHRYSGPVAAYAFHCLRGLQPEVVVVVGPSHYPYQPPILTSEYQAYQTPLGAIEMDRAVLADLDERLQARLGYGLAAVRDDPEHSLEVELPFLQEVLPPFRLAPLMLRDQSKYAAQALGECLAETLMGKAAVLVASSDLSHFYPQATALRLDGEMLRRVAAFDPQAVLAADGVGVGYACGRGAIAAVLWAAGRLGANQVTVLRHATSGDVTGDYDSVVGYGAAVIWQN
ncbi:MAG: AmmeMemoRadiSam system protein B [Chloroflexota bacterium]